MVSGLHVSPSDALYRSLQQLKATTKGARSGPARNVDAVSNPLVNCTTGNILYSFERASEYSFQAELPLQLSEKG
jgi:hypothetical protein